MKLTSLIKVKQFFANKKNTLYLGDALGIMSEFPDNSVDCIATSPPYYGQRDYGELGQIGLEDTPQEFVENLIKVFSEAKRILKPSGSLWVNIGDTYWNGKGQARSRDKKRNLPRFLRPQDKTGKKPLCVPKQQLLIPHRFAIAMQDIGWIVRNDNVWYKKNPLPDPTRDRCSSSHEYIFHFVKNRYYYFNMESVVVPSNSKKGVKPPSSVWELLIKPQRKKHIAPFPKEVVRIPILATCPSDGIFLDPFCGSGTSLVVANEVAPMAIKLGIDISEVFLDEAKYYLGMEKDNKQEPSTSSLERRIVEEV